MLEKVQNLEAALEQVESQSTQQLRDVVAHADEAHAEFRQERERLEADLSTAKAQVEVTGQLRVQVGTHTVSVTLRQPPPRALLSS